MQRETAEKFMKKMKESNKFNLPIVTELEQFKVFYEAEKYHKDYYNRNKNQGYCRFVIAKKIKQVEEKFMENIK
jgi:peptide-methionine (S)-S-oxide reductase